MTKKSFIPDRQSYLNGRKDTIEELLKWLKYRVEHDNTSLTVRRLIVKLNEMQSGD